MSFRGWLSIITGILLLLVVYFGRHEILHAWHLLGRVNILVLLLLIPIQLISYYAVGGMIFSYLRSKGDLKGTGHWTITRMALELNFVNHIIPSGGAAGFSYLSWVLNRYGVSSARATSAQLIRFVLSFFTFIAILIIAVGFLIFDNRVNRVMIFFSLGLVALAIIGTIIITVVIGNSGRMQRFSHWVTRTINKIVSFFTRGKKPSVASESGIEKFFSDLHDDYIAILKDKKILVKPLIWSIVANLADVALIFVTFLSLHVFVDPAVLYVAFGIAGASSIISVTPGGAGVYEAVMIAFLAISGVRGDVAIAGTLLARVTLLLGTIAFGYIFYQATIIKYGKAPLKKVSE